MTARFSDATAITVEGVGHAPNWEVPGEVVEEIKGRGEDGPGGGGKEEGEKEGVFVGNLGEEVEEEPGQGGQGAHC